MTRMAMTGVVKDELSRVPVVKPYCRKAEVSTLLRFAGGLHLTEGRVVIEAELDTGAVARRLRASITEVFGHPAEFRSEEHTPELQSLRHLVCRLLLEKKKR